MRVYTNITCKSKQEPKAMITVSDLSMEEYELVLEALDKLTKKKKIKTEKK